ncbi:MAG: hypothetical protein LAT65_15605 [Saccharospirillum sp.]|nr:hypothetical protein [Saccharospirillum sp.]
MNPFSGPRTLATLTLTIFSTFLHAGSVEVLHYWTRVGEAFNQNKGSIPARTDMSMNAFDDCAIQSMAEFVASAETNALMPSIAHGMATTGTVQGYFYEAVRELTVNPVDPANAARKLAKAIRYGQYVIR